MKSFQAHWDEPGPAAKPAPRLRAVSRVTPPRPRWDVLYAALGTVVALGGGGHLMIHDATLLTVADSVLSFALFVVIAVWVRGNRVALSRLHEPGDGHERLHLRIVRSRRARRADEVDADGRVVRAEHNHEWERRDE